MITGLASYVERLVFVVVLIHLCDSVYHLLFILLTGRLLLRIRKLGSQNREPKLTTGILDSADCSIIELGTLGSDNNSDFSVQD
jgi:hypothetical protein